MQIFSFLFLYFTTPARRIDWYSLVALRKWIKKIVKRRQCGILTAKLRSFNNDDDILLLIASSFIKIQTNNSYREEKKREKCELKAEKNIILVKEKWKARLKIWYNSSETQDIRILCYVLLQTLWISDFSILNTIFILKTFFHLLFWSFHSSNHIYKSTHKNFRIKENFIWNTCHFSQKAMDLSSNDSFYLTQNTPQNGSKWMVKDFYFHDK